jgi:hypothetical protein
MLGDVLKVDVLNNVCGCERHLASGGPRNNFREHQVAARRMPEPCNITAKLRSINELPIYVEK